MAALPASPVPTISPAEMQILISRSGLVLNPGQMADLVLAWRQVAGLIAAIPQGRPLVDNLAYSFRLPPAGSTAGIAVPPRSATATPAARSAAKPVARTAATPAARAAAKSAVGSAAKPAAKTAQPRSPAKPKPGPKSKAPARRRASGGR